MDQIFKKAPNPVKFQPASRDQIWAQKTNNAPFALFWNGEFMIPF